MNRLTSILTQASIPKKPSGSDRISITPAGEDALGAAKLQADHPSWYSAVAFLVIHDRTPEQIARQVAVNGADEKLINLCASTARHLINSQVINPQERSIA